MFLAERAVELSVAPKLGLSGSLASNSLIRRLGLEKAHETFVEAVVGIGTVEAAKAAQIDFEAQVTGCSVTQVLVLAALVFAFCCGVFNSG